MLERLCPECEEARMDIWIMHDENKFQYRCYKCGMMTERVEGIIDGMVK